MIKKAADHGKKPIVTEVDAAVNLEIAIGAIESSLTGKPVKLQYQTGQI